MSPITLFKSKPIYPIVYLDLKINNQNPVRSTRAPRVGSTYVNSLLNGKIIMITPILSADLYVLTKITNAQLGIIIVPPAERCE